MDRPNRHRNMHWSCRPGGEDSLPAGVHSRMRVRVRSLLFLQALCFVLLAMGCGRTRVRYEEIFRNDRTHVRLVERLDKSGEAVPKGFDHPWELEKAVLDDMLESVRYKKGKVVIGGEKLREAFPTHMRHEILQPLQRAFAQAGPDQAIDFRFVEIKSTLKVFRRAYLTDGIMFREAGCLNIAFRNLAFEQIGGEEEGDFAPNRQDPTKSPPRTSWTLVTGDGQSLMQAGDSGLLGPTRHTNWIRLDLSWPWGVSDAEIIEQAMPGMVDDLGTVLEKKLTLPEQNSPSREEIQERMQFLEELRREGTIAERAYREKKRELDRLYESIPK